MWHRRAGSSIVGVVYAAPELELFILVSVGRVDVSIDIVLVVGVVIVVAIFNIIARV